MYITIRDPSPPAAWPTTPQRSCYVSHRPTLGRVQSTSEPPNTRTHLTTSSQGLKLLEIETLSQPTLCDMLNCSWCGKPSAVPLPDPPELGPLRLLPSPGSSRCVPQPALVICNTLGIMANDRAPEVSRSKGTSMLKLLKFTAAVWLSVYADLGACKFVLSETSQASVGCR